MTHEIAIARQVQNKPKPRRQIADIRTCRRIDMHPQINVQDDPKLMSECLEGIRSLDDLRTYVHKTLCEKENLLPEQFSTTEMLLSRGGRDCGLQFSLVGPRSVRLGAIWASDQNVLYFYDARGERYLKIRLEQRISLITSKTA
jgi:hypothetical protein